jgi:beta-N-acetylhexosaminidase
MRKFLIYGAMLLMLASCLPEEVEIVPESPVVPSILHASVDMEDSETKTFLDGERHIVWNANDRISVFCTNRQNKEYRFQGSDGAPDGDFLFTGNTSGSTGTLSPSVVYAVYPYSSGNSILKSGTMKMTLPAEQHYRADSFGTDANTMVSATAFVNGEIPGNLSFKNVGGFIKFRLYASNSSVKVNSITLNGNNGEPIAGEAQVTMSPGGTPEMVWNGTTSSSITLVCDTPASVGTSKKNFKEFWVAVPPIEFTRGITFTIRAGGKVITNRVSAPVNVQRNHVVPIAAVELPYVKTYTVRSREEMTLWEKVGQLLMIQDYTVLGKHTFTVNSTLRQEFQDYPCGGYILKAENVQSPSQLTKFTADLHDLADYPLLTIDEEGGRVARIGLGGSGQQYAANFGEICTTNASRQAETVGKTGNSANAYASGNYIGTYLRNFGLDVNLAPVADVNSNPNNPVINNRSFGSDPILVANMVVQYLHGLQDAGVEGCLKHFPGHGDTGTDSHTGYTVSNKTWNQMLACEIVPFRRGIENEAKMIMTAHITLPYVMPSNAVVPSTLSYFILHNKLRQELGFQGVIITDSMGMGAITKYYSRSEAAILALKAGCDILLGPANNVSEYETVYNAIYNAVLSGEIPESRIDESVDRILALKRSILAERGQLQ